MIDHMLIILYEYSNLTPSEVQVLVSCVLLLLLLLHTHTYIYIYIHMQFTAVRHILTPSDVIQHNTEPELSHASLVAHQVCSRRAAITAHGLFYLYVAGGGS